MASSNGVVRVLATGLCAAVVACGPLAGCAKKPMEPAASADAMPGAAPPKGQMPATKGAYMGSKMVPGAGPTGGGTMGTEVGAKGSGGKTGGGGKTTE